MNECINFNGGKAFNGVIHIGAHGAEEAEDYGKNGVQKVFWIEANPALMKKIEERCAKFIPTNYLCNVCVSDVDGEKITFNFANNGQSSSMLKLGTHAKMYPHIEYVGSSEMITQRMETVLKQCGEEIKVEDFNFINIDVQGAELKVLKGFGDLLKLDNIRAVYTELNFEEVYEGCALTHEIDEYLKQFGFERVVARGECPQWGDGLYIKK